MSEDELTAMLFLLLLAGHETTVNLIGNGTLPLLEHPDQIDKLLADMSLLDGAIEEMLRFTNPVHQVAQRYCTVDGARFAQRQHGSDGYCFCKPR